MLDKTSCRFGNFSCRGKKRTTKKEAECLVQSHSSYISRSYNVQFLHFLGENNNSFVEEVKNWHKAAILEDVTGFQHCY